MDRLTIINTDRPIVVAKNVMDDYFSANYSQSFFHYGNVKSLKYRLGNWNEDIEDLKIDIKEDLEYLFGKHFDQTNIEVVHIEEGSVYKIKFKISLVKGETNVDLNREISFSKDQIHDKTNVRDRYYKWRKTYAEK